VDLVLNGSSCNVNVPEDPIRSQGVMYRHLLFLGEDSSASTVVWIHGGIGVGTRLALVTPRLECVVTRYVLALMVSVDSSDEACGYLFNHSMGRRNVCGKKKWRIVAAPATSAETPPNTTKVHCEDCLRNKRAEKM
jgi:hypothetical protein